MRNSKRLNSKIPPHVVAWLSAEGWTAEELAFVEDSGYAAEFCTEYDWGEEARKRVQRSMRIRARIQAQKGERNREYDSKNKLQRKNPPSWFGEGINRDLFK